MLSNLVLTSTKLQSLPRSYSRSYTSRFYRACQGAVRLFWFLIALFIFAVKIMSQPNGHYAMLAVCLQGCQNTDRD